MERYDVSGDWVTEPEDQESRETREVYALAGLALYSAQCLEHEIVNAISLATIMKTRPRKPATEAGPKEIAEYETYIDGVWDKAFRQTLGGLIHSLRKSGIREQAKLAADLDLSLDLRNRLVHRYFREKAETWFKAEGRRAMAKELTEMREQFVKTDRALHELIRPICEARGITDHLLDRYIELMKQGLSEDEALEVAVRESEAEGGDLSRNLNSRCRT